MYFPLGTWIFSWLVIPVSECTSKFQAFQNIASKMHRLDECKVPIR